MASRSYLYACTSRAEAEAGNFLNNHCWIASWTTPIFWYVCFDPSDEVLIKPEGDEAEAYPGLLAAVDDVAKRLARRRTHVLKLIKEDIRAPYAELFDQFSARIAGEFSDSILLEMGQLFAIMEADETVFEAWRNEIKLMASIETSDAELSLDDFPMASAFDIGEPLSPSRMQTVTAHDLAMEWRFLATSGPSGAEDFPPPPSDIEIDYAENMIDTWKPSAVQAAGMARAAETKKRRPWWKFWR